MAHLKNRLLCVLLCLGLLAGLLCLPAGAVSLTDFTDVPVTAWYRSELGYAVSTGIINGVTPTEFRGETFMTRAMFITILGRAFGQETTPGSRFPDVGNSEYYAPYVYWGVDHGIINGRDDGRFDPHATLSRQEMAAMMARTAENLGLSLTVQKTSPSAYSDRGQIADFAKEPVEFCWRYGLMQGDSRGFRPRDPVRRAEGMATLVRFAKNISGELGAAGPLRVIGTQLSDSTGSPVQLRGISTHGLAWFPSYVNKECFRQLRDQWGMNVVRLAMYTAEYGGYCSGGNQESLKQLIRDGVAYATELNMYVIIDWHILSDGNPQTHQSEAKAFFSEMSREFAGHTNVLYEICNEPNGGTTWGQIKSYAQEIIPAIRQNDRDAVILVGTPNWSQQVDQAAADPIMGYDNIMYTLHFYADTHRDSLRSTMVSALGKGLPIFVSEYGICDASGNSGLNTAEANKWIALLDQYHVSYVNWSLCNKAETASVLRSDCRKSSGFGAGDLSPAGVWLYEMLTGKAAAQLPATGAPQPSTPSGGSTVLEAGGGLTVSSEIVNYWSSGGETFYQYALTVKNGSGQACGSWKVSLPFSGSFRLQSSWNGHYTVSGNTLTITAMDYNGAIPAGGTVGDIGFIVSGSGGLGILQ